MRSGPKTSETELLTLGLNLKHYCLIYDSYLGSERIHFVWLSTFNELQNFKVTVPENPDHSDDVSKLFSSQIFPDQHPSI